MTATHVVWFRNDLRITDNRALHAACQDPQAKVIAVYIATPEQWKQHDMAPRQAAFIHQNLQCLVHALAGKTFHCFIISALTSPRALNGWSISAKK